MLVDLSLQVTPEKVVEVCNLQASTKKH